MYIIMRKILGNIIIFLFIIVLVLSVIKIDKFTKLKRYGIVYESTKYINGFACKECWNKSGQYVFYGMNSEKILLNVKKYEVRELLESEKYIILKLSKDNVLLPSVSRNPGQFNQKEYLASKEIELLVEPEIKDIKIWNGTGDAFFTIKSSFLLILESVRNSINNSLVNVLGNKNAGVAMGILTGDTSSISYENMLNYRNSGISHILAVSGMHIGFVESIAGMIFSRKKLNSSKRKLLSIFILFMYAGIAGFSASVTRAMFQSIYMLLGKIMKKPVHKVDSLCMACMLQLLNNPYILFNNGFVLSYTAVMSIYFIKPVLGKKIFFFGKLPEWLAVGISVNIGMIPIMINTFNTFSPIGIIVTLFASKLAYVICMCGFSIWFITFIPFGNIMVRIPVALITVFIELMNKISQVGAGIPPPFGAITVPNINKTYFVLYYTILFFLFSNVIRNISKKKIIIVTIVICTVISSKLFKARTQVLFFDVGQGLSALIKVDDIYGLVDTGDGRVNIGDLLLKQGVGELDFVLLTHGHNDHIGGFVDVMETHKIKRIIVPDNEKDEGIYKVCDIAERNNIDIIKIKNTRDIKINNTKLHFFVNEGYEKTSESDSVNNNSVIMLVENIDGNMLFTGDAQEETEDAFIEKLGRIDCQILQVAHHGSNTGTKYKNISIIMPEYAIISVGTNNMYGHPSQEVIDTLNEVGSNIKRTDECGAVKLTMQRGKITVWQKLKI